MKVTRAKPLTAARVAPLVRWLADGYEWSWMRSVSERCAADAVLERMAALGLIGCDEHPLGGRVWKVNGRRYGRTDS